MEVIWVADVEVWGVVQSSGSHKAEWCWSRFDPTNRLSSFVSSHLLLTMSLINNCTFEHSMGHQISREDAHFHLHTGDGQHYLSNQQVGMHHLDSFDESNWCASL